MADEVQGGDVVPTAQGVGDLFEAGAAWVENQDFAAGGQAGDELLPAAYGRVDNHQAGAARPLGGVARQVGGGALSLAVVVAIRGGGGVVVLVDGDRRGAIEEMAGFKSEAVGDGTKRLLSDSCGHFNTSRRAARL